VINWKLDQIGMNPSAEAYLVLHRFGAVGIIWSMSVALDTVKTM